MKTRDKTRGATTTAQPAAAGSRPSWAHNIDPMPVPYVNPFYGAEEEGRSGWRPVGHLSSARAAELTDRRKKNYADGSAKFIPARDVILTLLRAGEGQVVVWPPWPKDRPDSRRSYLRKLAEYHDIEVRLRDAGRGVLYVDIVGEGPRVRHVRPEVLSPIEAEKELQEYSGSFTQAYGTSFLRPEPDQVQDERDNYEPYHIYVKRLQEIHTQDPGAGVIYPYHHRRDERNQQIRLHQEARRWGMAISIKKLDPDHALLQVKRIATAPRDGRRSYERAHEEPPIESLGKGKVLVRGTKPPAKPGNSSPSPLSMEDL